ncbi:MAG: tripartite tricarboxylate transporter substrate binding protein [Proteobacteria bacterium]|nr:tripartite tricarboxylate transporter substrate binding protein [Pseudomonadota bacterium]
MPCLCSIASTPAAQALRATALGLTLGALALPASAQTWPSKPLRLVAPFAPGGGADFMARLIAAPLSAALGQPVVVENRVGAAGIIGYEFAAKAAPDGYTLVILSTTYAILPSLHKLPYDPAKDIQPVSLLSRGPYIVAVHPSLPVKTIRDLVSLAKAKPDEVTYASSGNGGNVHLVTALFASMAGVKLLHVPFKGTGPGVAATIGGQTSLVFGSMSSTLPLMRAGRLRGLAVTSAARNPAAPELPTVIESGLPGYDTFDWQGLAVPVGTPRPIVDRLNTEVAKLLQDRTIADRLLADGVVPSPSSPEAFAAFIGRDIEVVRKVVAQAGVRLD